MENFEKSKAMFENGRLTNRFPAHSLVLVNVKNGSIFSVKAKCRNTDTISVAKSMAKAVLASLRVAYTYSTTEAAEKSKKRPTNPMSQALSAHEIYVTNKNGDILQSGIKLENNEATLRSVFRFTKGQEIYKLVVEQGKAWDDIAVSEALKWWVMATIEQLNSDARFDEAFGKAADSTEKEDKAAEKAKKAVKKVVKKAVKTEDKAVKTEDKVVKTEDKAA